MSDNAAVLFQLAMAAKMIETRHSDGCEWSVEMVVRDAAGRVIMQCGDKPEAHWHSTIPDRQLSEFDIDMPSSSAGAGETKTPWAGPDWSQAPDGATAWTMDKNLHADWHIGNTATFQGHEVWHIQASRTYTAPTFDYTGDWRESLRMRPT